MVLIQLFSFLKLFAYPSTLSLETPMSDIELLRLRLRVVERRVLLLGGIILVLATALLVGAASPAPDVLRVRGLVVVDQQGLERIVLGAPMQAASSDPKLAGAVGLAVLDAKGHLNVAIGANNPLIMDGKASDSRIAAPAGLTIYDPRNGNERGGMAAFSDGRANVCLDYGKRSKEAVCMSVAPGDQYAAVMLNGTPDEPQFDRVGMFVGADGTGSLKAFGGGSNGGGVMIQAGEGPASIMVADPSGSLIGDIAPKPER